MNRRRPAARRRSGESSPRRMSWLYAAALGSTLLLALAAWSIVPSEPDLQPAPSAPPIHTGASSDASVDAEGRAQDVRRAGQPTEASPPLPTRPVDFATEAEQQRVIQRIRSATRRLPSDPDIYHIAALTYAELLQTEPAIEMFQKALELDANKVDVLVSYSDLLLQLGRHEEAVALIEQALQRKLESPELYLALGDAQTQLGEIQSAIDALRQALELRPETPLAHQRLAQAYLQLGEMRQAEEHARQAIDLGLQDRASYLALSTALLRQGKQEEALEIRAAMPAFEPPSSPDDDKYQQSFRGFASHTYSLLAGNYLQNGMWQEAGEVLHRALELDPANVPGLHALADLYRRQGDLAGAIRVHERLVELLPENPVNHMNLANLATAAGELGMAEKALRRASELDQTGNASLYLAQFLLETRRPAEAEKLARQAAESSASADAFLVWISALQAQNKMAEALTVLQRAQKSAPSDSRLRNLSF